MAKETYQLGDSAVVAYEPQKVAAIFGPLALATLNRVNIRHDERILDMACGTGIVARTIFERSVPERPIVGADLNPAMIEMARAVTADKVRAFDWHVAPVEALPFEAHTFSLVICQQGIQYFPDTPAALAEMRRVLAPGGRLVLSVWSGASAFFQAMAGAVSRHVAPEIGARYLAPFAYAESDALPDLLRAAGFGQVTREKLSIGRILRDVETSVRNELLANPAGPEVLERGAAVVDAILVEIVTACHAYRRGANMVVPQSSWLFTATAE